MNFPQVRALVLLHKWVQCYHHMQIDIQTLKHHMHVKRWISFSFHLLYGPPFAFKKPLRIIHTFLESIRMDCLHRTDFQLLFADFAYSEMLKEWLVCLTGEWLIRVLKADFSWALLGGKLWDWNAGDTWNNEYDTYIILYHKLLYIYILHMT